MNLVPNMSEIFTFGPLKETKFMLTDDTGVNMLMKGDYQLIITNGLSFQEYTLSCSI